MTTRVYVVDDDAHLRAGLALLLEESGYSAPTFASGDAFLEAYPNLPPGCIIVDLLLDGMSGLELLRRLIALGCRWPKIVLTGRDDPSSAEPAMETGVIAYLEKPVRRAELLAALLRAQAYLRGDAEVFPDPELAHRVTKLTRRERDVLAAVMDRMINKEIAARLGISESSVKGYRRKVMAKLQARTPAELVMLALKAGFTGKSGA